MKYNKIFNLIKDNCEEIYNVNECENFLNENELDLKWFQENDLIIFSNLCNDYNEILNVLNINKIKFTEYKDNLDLNYIVL